jgi:hypothetical protein
VDGVFAEVLPCLSDARRVVAAKTDERGHPVNHL